MKRRIIGFELITLANLMKRELDRAEQSKKIEHVSGANKRIIMYLYANRDKDIFQRDLEENFSVRRSTVSASLQLMEKKGFILRQSVDNDARLKKIVLTPKALEAQKVFASNMIALQKRLTDGLKTEELNTFFSVIDKLKNKLE